MLFDGYEYTFLVSFWRLTISTVIGGARCRSLHDSRRHTRSPWNKF